ncbi:MAG: SRPBCC family protein [Bdellovibrionia bacterium]
MTKKKKSGLVGLAIIAAFLGYVAISPAQYIISRQIAINAPVEKIFPYLNNSKLAEQWGPWLEVDPDTKMNYSGPDSGVGSRASWAGGKQLGTGSATIVESIPNQLVRTKLEYVEPMQMIQDSVYSATPSGSQTIVTWKVTGQNNFMGRLMCVFMNMDKMVGDMFEKGLSNLKKLVETKGAS